MYAYDNMITYLHRLHDGLTLTKCFKLQDSYSCHNIKGVSPVLRLMYLKMNLISNDIQRSHLRIYVRKFTCKIAKIRRKSLTKESDGRIVIAASAEIFRICVFPPFVCVDCCCHLVNIS